MSKAEAALKIAGRVVRFNTRFAGSANGWKADGTKDTRPAAESDDDDPKKYGLICRPATVRAILRTEGAKSQMRRVATYRNSVIDEGDTASTPDFWKSLAFDSPDVYSGFDDAEGSPDCQYLCVPEKRSPTTWHRIRPRVRAQGFFWVREAWGDHTSSDGGPLFAYAATDDPRLGPWRTPTFMRREASRVTLEVTGTRVERLQDISEEDIRGEGIQMIVQEDGTPGYSLDSSLQCQADAKAAFAAAWAETEGSLEWARNPHVWVYDLRRLMDLSREQWRQREIARLVADQNFHR